MKTKILLLLSLVAISFTITSCKKKGCTDNTAVNFDKDAGDDDGSCDYTTLFYGNYSGIEDCAGNQWSYSITITATTNIEKVLTEVRIYNFVNSGQTNYILANIRGRNMTIPSQTFTLGSYQETVVGTGTLNGNTLTINYTQSSSSGSGACSFILTRQ